MGGTFKSEIQKNVKKIKLGDYIGRYARKKKTVPSYSTLPYISMNAIDNEKNHYQY
jgi:hypothetical protein